jgi:Tol biopolymer transport system component
LHVSRRGDQLVFFNLTPAGDYSLILVDTNGKNRVLSRAWIETGGTAWSPDDKEIWFGGIRRGTDPGLWAVDLAGRERRLIQITGLPMLQDLAPDGSLLVTSDDSRIGIRCLATGATEERDLGWLDASSIEDISSDGSEIVFQELSSGQGQNGAIYLRRTDGSPAIRLGYGVAPSLSPDGKWITCVRRDRDAAHLLLLPTGAGEEKILSTGAIEPISARWSPDGQRLLFNGIESNQPRRTYLLELATEMIKPVTLPGQLARGISPDGEFTAIINGGKLSLHSLAGGRDIAVGAVEPGVFVIRFSGDGRYLFLGRAQEKMRNATILRMDVRTGHTEVWQELKLTDPVESFFGPVRLTPDGKSYAYSFQRDSDTLYLVKGVK